jgi:hypothetical protein
VFYSRVGGHVDIREAGGASDAGKEGGYYAVVSGQKPRRQARRT